MRRWTKTVKIGDIWKNEAMTFPERRKALVTRLRSRLVGANPHSDPSIWDLENILDELFEAEDVETFDEVWDAFYDWCDEHSVWVDRTAP